MTATTQASRWDAKYAADEFFYGTQPNDFLRAQATALPRAGRVLCLGEGEGRNAAYLAQLGHAVTALDQSPVGLAKAAGLALARGVAIDTCVADLADYTIEAAAWDGIVSIWCHLPLALRRRVHRAVATGLRTGGVLILESYSPDQLRHATGGPRDPDLLPTLAELRQDLAGLSFEHLAACERDVHEGQGHRGLSAVVQVVARRTR